MRELDSNNDLEVLRSELVLVANHAPMGSHTIVADELSFSTVYIHQIRKGRNMINNTPENRETMRDIISSYRQLIRDEQRKLSSI